MPVGVGTRATTLLVDVSTLTLTLSLMLVLGVEELEMETPAVLKSAGRVTECARAHASGERPYARKV